MLLLLFSGNVSGNVSGSGTAGSVVITGQSGTAALTGFGTEGSVVFTGQSGIGSIAGVGVAGSIVFTGQSGTAALTGVGTAGSIVFTGQDGSGSAGGDVSGSGTAGSVVFTGQDGAGVSTATSFAGGDSAVRRKKRVLKDISRLNELILGQQTETPVIEVEKPAISKTIPGIVNFDESIITPIAKQQIEAENVEDDDEEAFLMLFA
jgi:hypothetical protein